MCLNIPFSFLSQKIPLLYKSCLDLIKTGEKTPTNSCRQQPKCQLLLSFWLNLDSNQWHEGMIVQPH